MSPGMVRTGGIMAFVMIAVAIVGTIAIGAAAAGSMKAGMTPDQMKAAMGGAGVGGIILGLVINAMLIFVFWTTKGLFNSSNYRIADVALLIIMAIIALSWVLSLVGGSSLSGMSNLSQTIAVGGIMNYVSLVVMLLMFVALVWFSIGCLGYGKSAPSGLWKAIGILYLISFACLVVAILVLIIGALTLDPTTVTRAQVGGLAAFGGILILIGMFVALAGWICHGIGLITGAGRMTRQAT